MQIHISKRKIFLLFLLFLFLPQFILADSDSERKTRLFGTSHTGAAKFEINSSNSDIGVLAEGTGMFSIGTTSGKALLYGYPYSARTSHCHFYVDGEVAGSYSDTSDAHPVPAELIEFPHLVGDTIICRWRFRDIEFSQKLVPTYLGEDAQIRIEYTATNIDATSHLVGLLLFLDTMIGTNDCAPIATPVGYFATEQQFIGDLPSFWQAFEESPFQDESFLVGQGTLSGWSATAPDVLLYGDFWHYHATAWDYVFSGGIYSDSSVLLRWNAHLLPAGASRTFVTYYGIGSADRSLGEVSLSIAAPAQIVPAGCSGFSPDTFSVNLLVGCTDTLRGAVANIIVPPFLTLLDDAEKSIEPAILPPSGVGTASWNVVANSPTHSSTDSLRIELSAAGYSPVSVGRSISIVLTDGAAPNISMITSLSSPVETDSFTIQFNIIDGDGIDTTSLSALLDGEPIEFNWFPPIMTIHLDELTDGAHSLVLPAISDTFGCIAEPFTVNFDVNIPSPPEFSLLSPIAGNFTACIDNIIKILVISESDWDILDFSLALDGVSLPLGRAGDTITTFYGALSDGEHNIELSGEAETGAEVDSVWTFNVDRTAPTVSPISMLMELRMPSDLISFSVSDDGAGVNFSDIAISIAFGDDTISLSGTSPGIDISDGNVNILLSETGLSFDGCAEVSIEMTVPDLVEECGPNILDTIALRATVPCTPPEIVLLEPTGATSCDSIDVAILLLDDEGIIADSAYVIFAGTRYDLAGPNLYLSADTLFFTVSVSGVSSGEHTINIGGITDTWGNSIAEGASVNIFLDREPPTISDVVPSGVLSGFEAVGFRCSDDGSGISVERSFIVCDGDTIRLGSGLVYDGEVLFVPAAFWLSSLDGESLTVCSHIVDNVAQCEPNFIDTCVIFPVEQSGPAATMLVPLPGQFIGCDAQEMKILWLDPDGFDRSASTISFGGSTYHADNTRFIWLGDTVSFDVDLTSFSYNFTINLHGVDGLGFSADTNFDFNIDRTSPVISVISPAAGSRISYPYEQWKILLSDGGAGIDPNTISLIVDGDLFTLLDGAVSLREDTLIFDPNVADMDFGNIVNVAVQSSDGALGCPNDTQTQWTYSVFHPDLWWELISPQGVASCDTVDLQIAMHANFNLDYSEARCIVNGNRLPFTVSSDTISAQIAGAMLYNGVNSLSLYDFSNADNGLLLEDTVFAALLYDALPPTIIPVYPSPGSQVAAGSPLIAVVEDDISGLDRAGVMVSVNGINISISTASWHGDTLIANISPGILGDIEVCITAADEPQVCDPNETRLCWQFTVPGAGPQITLLEPADGLYSHDKRQKIVARINSENEIEAGNIVLTVNGSEYNIHSSNLTYSDEMLTFTPQNDWSDSEDVQYNIVCTDNIGLSAEFSGHFLCDFSPPVCTNAKPSGVIQGIPEKISIDISDDGAGVNPQSIVFRVGELFIPFDNYSLTYNGNTAVLDLSAAGVHLSAMDTIDVGIIAADKNTGYGEPNVMSDCTFWFFSIKSGCSVAPTPFTPNGDGINDNVEFAVYSDESIKVSIFTMDGVLVRKLEGNYTVRWDGRDNYGRNAPSGPYLYTIESNGKVLRKGVVVIAR